jgi:probable rRNA maturation factor
MPDPAITLIFRRSTPELDRAALREFAQRLAGDLGGGREFTCMMAGDMALRRFNRDFLGHDYATDVLSFPSGSAVGSLGDLAISLDRAADQAAEHGHSLDAELRILMLHGVLHLAGHDHEKDGGEMNKLEIQWRTHYGLPAGLIERAGAR